jgi:hypothetical protein
MTTGLLERESTGGATARVGFEYQDAYVLQHLPEWLSQSAFSHVVSEAIGDMEVCYFAPSGGFLRVMYEAKNHTLNSTEFWDEIATFKSAFEAAPLEFVRFVLVCGGFNGKTSPLVSKLERLRGVGASFQTDSAIVESARLEILEWAANASIGEALVQFVLDYVYFESYASESADAAFVGQVQKFLPSIDLGGRQSARLRDKCKAFIASSSFGPVYRLQIERAVCEQLEGDSHLWLGAPTTVLSVDGTVPFRELGLDVGSFNGPARATKSLDEWRSLSDAAGRIGDFIKESTARRSIELDGKQRMSTACVLGYAYSATRGFLLQVNHNGQVYRTDVHDRSDGHFFDEAVLGLEDDSIEGTVCIGFPTPVGTDLQMTSAALPAGLPSLTFTSARTIGGMKDLNLAVAECKAALVRFKSQSGLSKLHLFIKAPSIFSMVLGHRLNGVCAIQLYDWVDGAYVPTALLTA